MLASLEEIAGPDVVRRVRFEPDTRIEKIVCSWPKAVGAAKAHSLGFTADKSMQDIIRAFIADELNGKFVA